MHKVGLKIFFQAAEALPYYFHVCSGLIKIVREGSFKMQFI